MERDHFTLEVLPAKGADDPRGRSVAGDIRALGLNPPPVHVTDLYFLSAAGLDRPVVERAARAVFADTVIQVWRLLEPGAADRFDPSSVAGLFPGPERVRHRATVKRRRGVMDPVEASAVQALADLGVPGALVRTACRYYFSGALSAGGRAAICARRLAHPA